MSAFQKGISFADWRAFDAPRFGLYPSPQADQSLTNLVATGANWISLVVRCGQDTIQSTEISCESPATASNFELRRVVDLAHSLSLRVMLKPQLDLVQELDSNLFRGHIGTAFTTEDQWQAWFTSYQGFISGYASFAEEAGVDLLVIGVELGSTTHREQDWRGIVEGVRRLFTGPITYASLSSTGAPPPHGEEERIVWWDAVEYIGIDAYYRLTSRNDPSVAELKEAWTERGHLALLEDLSGRFQRPIILTEFGYRSADGTNTVPGAYRDEPPLDLQEQADAYQAALEVLWGQPWLAGIFWWQWFANPNIGGDDDNGFTPYGKPAEEVLKTFYLEEP